MLAVEVALESVSFVTKILGVIYLFVRWCFFRVFFSLVVFRVCYCVYLTYSFRLILHSAELCVSVSG